MQIKTEWLVRRVDKVSSDPVKNAQLTKRGDVIVVKEYPCEWSIKEIESPEWLILQTDVDYIDAIKYLEAQDGFDYQLEGAKRRKKGLDLDKAFKDLPSVAPDQAAKAKDNFKDKFLFAKGIVNAYTRVKA